MGEHNEAAVSTAAQLHTWRENTRKEWSDAEKVEAWRNWGRGNIRAQRDATNALLTASLLSPNMRVLDVAGGGGDPSLAVARELGPGGHVTVTDVSEGMLETTKLFAREDGLTNLAYHQADAEDLPFPDMSFDRATCRCAVMFFADHDRGLREIRRVLKPGGRAAFLAWGPLERIPLFTSIFGPIRTYLNPPTPPPGTPWPFKFSEPGSLAAALETAGFQEVSEIDLTSDYRWSGPPEEVLQVMQDMGGLHGMLADLPGEQREALLGQALENYRAYSADNTVVMPLAYVLASGVR